MGLCYAAMAGPELAGCTQLPENTAWLSCHFSPRGNGLSNLPEQLPPGSLLILDDLTPPRGHDRERVTDQLACCMKDLVLCGVLLDFQRPGDRETGEMAHYLCTQLPCPVILSLPYGDAGDGPLLLPPPPLNKPLSDYTAPWKGRSLWLEAATGTQRFTVTQEGCHTGPLQPLEPVPLPFLDESLCCKYGIEVREDQILFTLSRTPELLQKLLAQTELPSIALYQELYDI